MHLHPARLLLGLGHTPASLFSSAAIVLHTLLRLDMDGPPPASRVDGEFKPSHGNSILAEQADFEKPIVDSGFIEGICNDKTQILRSRLSTRGSFSAGCTRAVSSWQLWKHTFSQPAYVRVRSSSLLRYRLEHVRCFLIVPVEVGYALGGSCRSRL